MTRYDAVRLLIVLMLAACISVAAPSPGVTTAQDAVPKAAAPADRNNRIAPSARPVFREVLKGDVYPQRLKGALDKIGELPTRPSRVPPLGRRILSVRADSSASKLGLQLGDVLIRLDGERLGGDGLALTGEKQELEYYAAQADSVKTVRVETDWLGVHLDVHWHPEQLYLKRTDRVEARDRDVLVGLLARSLDPDLAETAWFRAIAAGYQPDSLSDQAGAEIALLQNRPEVAAEFAWFVEKSWKPEEDEVSPMLLYRVALANYHLTVARDILLRSPKGFRSGDLEEIETLIALHESRPENLRGGPAPSARAADLYRDNLVPHLRGSNRHAMIEQLWKLRNKGRSTIDAPADHYDTVAFETGDPAPNFDLTFMIAGVPADGPAQFDRTVAFRILGQPSDVLGGKNDAGILLTLGINQLGQVMRGSTGSLGESSLVSDLAVPEGFAGDHVFRLIRVDGQAELFLNGHRIYFGPMETTPRVRFDFTVVGCGAALHSFKLDELLGTRQASRP